MKYAKIKNNTLEYAPRNKNGVSNWINDVEAVLAEGYLPYEPTEYPTDGKRYNITYQEQEGKIITVYVENPQTPQERIVELKQFLADTDYVVIKIAEGEATNEEYAEVLAERKAWRVEINKLELTDQASEYVTEQVTEQVTD